MRTIMATLLALGATVLGGRAGNVSVVLDSTNGASGFQVLDAQSNALLEIRSDRLARVGGAASESEQLDQSQGAFTGEYRPAECWQSFTVGRAGKLTSLTVWHNQYFGNENITLDLRRGGGATGTVIWSQASLFDEYWGHVPVTPAIPVQIGDVFTLGISPTGGGTVELGDSSANPYAGGQSCRGASYDLLFMTWVIPAGTALTVGGDILTTGSVAAAAFCGDGAGLTNIGNASLAAGAAIDPAKISGTALTQGSSFGGDVSGTFGALQVRSNAIGAAEITNDTVVRSLNGLRDTVTLQAGQNIAVSNGAGTITVSAEGSGVGVPSGAIVLSATATNRALERADFSLFYKTENRDAWTLATASPGWSNRANHAMNSYNGRLWVLGGMGSAGQLADLWSSSNGVAWTQLSADFPPGRNDHSALVFSNRLWCYGGAGSAGYLHDIHSTTDGVHWLGYSVPLWSPRAAHATVVFDGKVWLLGGEYDIYVDSQLHDVWCSSNGYAFSLVTNAAPWSIRRGFGAVVFDGKIWIYGGYGEATYKNDVWCSSNGATWTQATGAAPWTARDEFSALVYDGRMWVIGGSPGDIWNSADGTTWTQVTNAAPWGSRIGQAATVFDDRMWLSAGFSGTPQGDVWYSGKPDLLSGFYLYQKQ